MKVKVYGYGKCSTCRKANSYLKGLDIPFQSIDITEKAPTKKEIKEMIQAYDGQSKKVLNTSGVEYRRLGLSQKLSSMPEKELVDLLAGNGRLIKRPFLVLDQEAKLVGFKQEEWRDVLES